MFCGAVLLVLMYVWMFCAICRYSFLVSVPIIMVSVPGLVGCVTLVSVMLVRLVLFRLRDSVVISSRNSACVICVPFIVMSVGSVWYASMYPFTSVAAFRICCTVKVFVSDPAAC